MADPRQFEVNRHVPRVILEVAQAVDARGERRALPIVPGSRVLVPPGTAHFEVGYLAPGAFDLSRVRFQHHWRKRGQTVVETQTSGRLARASLLAPGAYELEVRAVNHHGIVASEGATLAFVIQPFYWQTWPFRLGAAIAGLLAAGGGLAMVRRHELLKREAALAQERALAHERARLAAVMEGTTDTVGFADPDLTLRYLNSAGRRMLGLDEQADAEQLRLREFYPLRAAEHVLNTAIPQAIEQGSWTGEVLMVRRDGKEFPVSQVIVAHRDARGELRFLSTIIRNLSDRKASEEALAAALKHARLLADLGRNLAETIAAPAAARLIMEAADELIHWDCAWVRLWHEEKSRFERVYGVDTVDGHREEFESIPGQWDTGSPLVREVVAHGARLILRRREDEPVPGLRPFGGDRRSMSLLFVPMRHAGKVVGVVSVQSYQAQAYNLTHLELLQSLSEHCAGNLHRIEAERAVRVSENRWRLAISVARLGTWDWDFKTNEVSASPELAPMFAGPGSGGLSAEPDFRHRIHPDDQPAVGAAIQSAIARQGAFHAEFRVVWTDGSVHWIEGRGEVFCDAKGTPERLVGVSADVTERREAENAVRQSENRFRNLVECMAEGLLMTDFDDTIRFTNRRACEMLGYSAEELVGHKGYDVFMTAGQRAETLARNQQRQQGVRETYEVSVRRKDGAFIWMEVSAAPFRDTSGQVIGTLGALTEITERRQAQTRLELLSQTLKSTRDCVAVADLEDRVVFVNDAFLTTYGYAREEIIGQPTSRLRAPVSHSGPAPDIRAATLKDDGWHGELLDVRQDGTEFPVELWTSVVRNEAGQPVATVGVARDISERRKLEAQFRQAQKMEGIGQLAGGVAHDFNNLLTVIQGHVTLLLDQPGQLAATRESLAEIGQSAARAAALTRQLLTFSRRQPLRMELLDLNAVVPGVSRMLQRLVGEHITLQLRLAAQPVGVRADAAMLEQALLNLVVNARDAMPDGGRVIIETCTVELDERAAAQSAQARPGAFVTLTVSDTGAGIAPEVLPHIFEPFYTTKDVGQGTGLGLATVFGIAQQHQGWVTVYSVPGGGSTFRLYLPRHTPEAPALGAATAPPAPVQGGSETILVVEDEPSVRMFVTKVLARLGYRVLEAPTGAAALELWTRHQAEVRLVITDMVMPDGMSGSQLARRLHAGRPGLPIIFTSGYSAELAGRDLNLAEGENFLGKPFEIRALTELVRRRLDGV